MIGTRLYKDTEDMKGYTATADWCNRNNALIEDRGNYYEVVEYVPPAPTEQEALEAEVASLKAYLSDTDWCVIKCMELGIHMNDKYPEVLQRRAEARDRINEIEEVLRTEEDA